MQIFFATWQEQNQGESLTNKKASNRLLSYFFIKEINSSDIIEYVIKGIFPIKKKGVK